MSRCFFLVILVLAGITLFYFGLDRFQDQGHNLLPNDPGAFLLKKRNKPQAAPPGTIDGGVRFRLAPKQAIEFSLEAPPTGQFLRLSGRIRTHDLLPGNKPWHQARLLMISKDSNGKRIARIPHLACAFSGVTDWMHCNQIFEIPAGAETLVMRFVHSGLTGTAELEAPSLVPVVVRGWYDTLRYGLMILWFSVALACLLKTRLWRLRLGWLIVLLLTAILTGVAAPDRLVSTLIQQGFQRLTAARAWLTATELPLQPNFDIESPTKEDGKLRGAGDHGTTSGQAEKTDSATPPSEEPTPINAAKKSGHAVLFAALGAVSLLVLVVGGNPVSHPRTVMVAIAAITIFAASTEVLQMLTTDRGPSFRDLGIDVAGACAGLAFTWIALQLLRYLRVSIEKQ